MSVYKQVKDYINSKTKPVTTAEAKANKFNASGAATVISDYKKRQKKMLEEASRP